MQIGNYKVTHKLGAGGMGIVFRAVDASGRPFAIKMIGSHAEIDATLHVDKALQNTSALALNRRMMLVREARLAMELKHPNIAKTFDYGQHGGLLYIVVEYLHGRSLDKVLPIHGAVPLSTKVRIIRQICDALEYAHQQGVMHRDVKPHNTFVLLDANVKVLDFGLAARLREPLPGQIPRVGTYHYMAPEVVAESSIYDARVDIWSTGVTLYQLLTGRLPFYAPSLGQLLRNITHAPCPRLDPQIPHASELEWILSRALAKSPLERYASAGEFARDLRRLEDEDAERRLSPADGSNAVGEDLWWASTVAPLPASPGMHLNQPGETISMMSGNIQARRRRHTARFVKYNAMVFPLVPLVVILSAYYALYIILTYSFSVSPHAKVTDIIRAIASTHHNVATSLVTQLPGYVFGWGVPAVVAISIGLGVLAVREKFAEIPRCRKCKVWMKHLSRIDRFSYTETSRAHASSDCLAALRENLWEDAAKLLSMHGELFSPKTKPALSLVRYYLDFYACRLCGDESAILTTEDLKGRALTPREEYSGAYKTRSEAATKPSFAQRWFRFIEGTKRALTLATESIDQTAAKFVVVWSLFLGVYYYPQAPQLLRVALDPAGLLAHKPPVTITSSPMGQLILVDGKAIVTPKTFFWSFDTVHTIAGFSDRRIDGSVYHFQELTGKHPNLLSSEYEDRVVCSFPEFSPSRGCNITITRTGEPELWVPRALIPSYTVVFSNGELPDLPKHQQLLGAQSPQETPRLQNYRSVTAIQNSPLDQVEQKVVVTSVPKGLSVMVDKDWILTPKTYLWRINSTHTLAAPAGLQVFSQSKSLIKSPDPIYYADGRWTNDVSEHTITVTVPGKLPLTEVTYTAKFRRVILPPVTVVGQTGLQPEEKK